MLTSFSLQLNSNLIVKTFLLLHAAVAMTILHLISRVHLALFVITLHKQLKYSKLSSCFWPTTICTVVGCLEILITLVFATFISIPQHLPVSINPKFKLQHYWRAKEVSRLYLTLVSPNTKHNTYHPTYSSVLSVRNPNVYHSFLKCC